MKKIISYLLVFFSVLFLSACFFDISKTTTREEDFDIISEENEIEFTKTTFVYDGKVHKLEAKNIPSDMYALYENNEQSQIGEYVAVCNIYKKSNNELVKTIKANLIIDKPNDKYFDLFCDQFFNWYLGNDAYAWNIYTVDSMLYDYVRPEGYTPSWYSFTPITDTNRKDYYDYMIELSDMLEEEYDYESLNMIQKQTYLNIQQFLTSSANRYDPSNGISLYADLNYIDSYGGYVANFTQCMTSYKLRNKTDVLDVISYIESTDEAFETYITYIEEKNKAGYPISDVTLNAMNEYLLEIQENGTDFYLYDYFKNKINACSFLTSNEKNTYITKINNSLTNDFLKGIDLLIDGINDNLGNVSTNVIKDSQTSKKLYELNLEDLLGYDHINMEEYVSLIISHLDYYVEQYDKSLEKLYSLNYVDQLDAIAYLNGQKQLIDIEEPEVMLKYLKEFSKTVVPSLNSDPKIEFAYMDKTIEDVTNAVAYYTKSSIDGNPTETITLNGKYINGNNIETLSTIAHEGYPGHLYAYVNSKENGIPNLQIVMSNVGHAEGWAKYVETKLYDFIIENTDDEAIKVACELMKYNEYIMYLIYTRIDVAIHYQSYTVSDVRSLLDYYGLNKDAAQSIYDSLFEIPTQYAAYGYGLAKMTALHTKAKQELGDKYDEIDFNKEIHAYGWIGYEQLEDVVDNYIRLRKNI